MKKFVIALLIALVIALAIGGIAARAQLPPGGGPTADCNDLRLFWQMTDSSGRLYVCTFGNPDYWALVG